MVQAVQEHLIDDKPGDPGYEENLEAFERRISRGDKVEPREAP